MMDMGAGYVYILENESYDNMVKIGATSYDGFKRAKELSNNSGVPTPFRVVHQEYVNDCLGFEKELHKVFAKDRVNRKREFFKVSSDKVISVIQEFKKLPRFISDFHFSLDLYGDLKRKYKDMIKEELLFCRLHQIGDVIYVEFGLCESQNNSGWMVISQNYYLDFMADLEDDLTETDYFNTDDSISINYDKFINLDLLSLAMCIGEIFKEESLEGVT